jgi:hypothetical protein
MGSTAACVGIATPFFFLMAKSATDFFSWGSATFIDEKQF